MKINHVLMMFREAELFRYLTSLSQVNQMTVKICQSLLNSLTDYPWTTVQRLSRTLRQQNANVKFVDVEQVVSDLLERGVLIQQGSQVMFKARLASNDAAASQSASQSNDSSSAAAQSASAMMQSSSKSSSSSVSQSSSSDSSEEDWVTDQLNDDSDHNATSGSGLSPLSSYFASVNATLNDDYRKSSSADFTGHRDHLVNHNDLTRSNSVSNSIESSVTASISDHHLDFATTPVSDESFSSSSSSSASASRVQLHSSQASASSKNSKSTGHDETKRSAGNRFQSIASSLFKRVSFMSLMSHPSKVKQLAKAQFNLVVAARKYEGMRQADNLFKYEFKMNYQKFGKIGNRINNYLMKDVSSHNK